MDRLLFGTGGTPNSTPAPRSTVSGIARIAQLGLDSMEIEFVQGVKMSDVTAAGVKDAAQRAGVGLTAHGPYAINLNSADPEKAKASKERILQTARVAGRCGARSIVFHAGFYGDGGPAQAYRVVKEVITEVMGQLRREDNRVWVRTELTGKRTDFGTLDELLQLALDVEGLGPCIDFAHLHARTGRYNSYEEFGAVLSRVQSMLGRNALENLHAHVSGIQYTSHGESRHLPLKESDFRYGDLMQAFRDYSVKGFVVCESPNLEEDAMLLKQSYAALR